MTPRLLTISDFKDMQTHIDRIDHDPLAYIVLDHSQNPRVLDIGHDGDERRYIRCSPAMLDEVKHVPPSAAHPLDAILTGVPVYRREDLPQNWPQVCR